MLKNKFKIFLKKYWWWFLFILIIIIFHSSHLLDSDEGVILNGAWNIINGKRLYVDFFEFVSPGSYYLTAIWWKFFSVSYLSAKILALSLLLLGGVGVFQLGKQFGLKYFIWIPPLFFFLSSIFWPIINHNTFSLVFLIWSVVFGFIALKGPNQKFIFFLTGFLCGITTVFLQHKGFIVVSYFSLIFSYLVFLKKKIYLKSFLFFGVGFIIPLLILCFLWSPLLLFSTLISFPLGHYLETNLVSLILWSCVGFFSVILYIIITHFQKNKYTFLYPYLLILQIFLLISVLPRADLHHLTQVLFPFFILLTVVFENIKLKTVFKKLIIIFFFVCIFFFLIISVPLFKKPPSELYQTINYYCQNNSFYSGPFLPGLYFEFRKHNQLPYSILITNQQTPAQFKQAAQILNENPPHCVVLNYTMVKKFNYTTDNPVDNFIQTHYRFVKNLNQQTGLYLLND